MAALSTDRHTPRYRGVVRSYKVNGGSTIYAGSMVAIDTDGYARPAANTASYLFVGICREKVDNSAGSDGDKSVEVDCEHRMVAELTAAGLAITDIGAQVYVSDDQTVTKTAGNGVKVGRLMGFTSATVALVGLEPLNG